MKQFGFTAVKVKSDWKTVFAAGPGAGTP